MALSATKAAKVSFVLDAAPNFIIEDVSPYVSEGIALADVVGIIKLTGPSGIIYENTDFDAPDIDANVSLSKSDIAIPVDSSGAALLGTYELTYTIRVGGSVQAGDYVVSKTVSFTFIIPTAVIAMTSNVWAARLDSKDNTTYTVDTIIPSLARTHTVMFEDNKKVANTVGSAALVSVSYPNFWTGRYTTDLSTIATYNLGSNWYVVATITGKETHDIVADLTACSVSCGIKNMNQRYRNAVKKGNDELVEELTLTLNRISLLLALFKLLQLCGDTDGATETLVMIKEEGEFTDDCCSGDSPQQILPLAPDLASNYEVTAGLGMVVTPSSGGGTTSFEVALQQALKDKIDVLIKTLIEAGTGIGVDIR
jgi:hypothetical protein